MPSTLKHISYVSWRKVDELYDQINKQGIVKRIIEREKGGEAKLGASASFFSFLTGNADVSGSLRHAETEEQVTTEMGKFQAVINYVESRNLITDLNSILTENTPTIPGSFCYKYSGRFDCTFQNIGMLSVDGNQTRLNIDKKEREALEEESGERDDGRLFDKTCLLTSSNNYVSIRLAASLKYFANMGGSGDDLYPTSSNSFFFKGMFKPLFDTIFFIVGNKGRSLYGTPLVMVYNTQEDIEIEL